MAGTVRAAVGTVLALCALQAITDPNGSGGDRAAGFLGDVSHLLDRLLDPNVPAIPNLAAGDKWGGDSNTRSGSSAPQGQQPKKALAIVRGGIPIPAVPHN